MFVVDMTVFVGYLDPGFVKPQLVFSTDPQ